MLTLVSTSTKLVSPQFIIKNGFYIANNLISSISYLQTLSFRDTELRDLMVKCDILEDLGIIKNFVEEKRLKTDSKTIIICIDNLSETLHKLDSVINSITSKIDNHKNLWFNSFRSYNIHEEKKLIPILIEQMKHRFDILIKVSSVL